jgi:iron complex outermembrane receptor protein
MTQRLATDDRIAFPFGCSSEGLFDRFCSDGSVDLYDFRSEGEKRRSSAAELSLRGQIETGVLRHRLDVGWLSTRLETRLPPQAFNYAGSGRIDGSVQVDAAPLPLFDVQGRDERSSEVFLRDRIDLAADWQLWAGLRYSRLNRDGVRQSFTTPWLALAWQADEHTMAYTSWGRGVEAETAPQLPRYSNAGRALPALESRQFETGVKHANGGLEASLVGFAITRPQTGDFGACDVDASCVRAIDGSAQHRGIEASAATRHGPWRLQAGALMLHARREGAADAAINGLAPVNVPARSLRAEVRYAPTAGSEVSALLVHEASRAALPDHSATIDSWTRLDLAVRHEQRLGQATRIIWRAAIDNATNRKAWRESPYQFSHAYLFPLAPRSLRVSAQFEL